MRCIRRIVCFVIIYLIATSRRMSKICMDPIDFGPHSETTSSPTSNFNISEFRALRTQYRKRIWRGFANKAGDSDERKLSDQRSESRAPSPSLTLNGGSAWNQVRPMPRPYLPSGRYLYLRHTNALRKEQTRNMPGQNSKNLWNNGYMIRTHFTCSTNRRLDNSNDGSWRMWFSVAGLEVPSSIPRASRGHVTITRAPCARSSWLSRNFGLGDGRKQAGDHLSPRRCIVSIRRCSRQWAFYCSPRGGRAGWRWPISAIGRSARPLLKEKVTASTSRLR